MHALAARSLHACTSSAGRDEMGVSAFERPATTLAQRRPFAAVRGKGLLQVRATPLLPTPRYWLMTAIHMQRRLQTAIGCHGTPLCHLTFG